MSLPEDLNNCAESTPRTKNRKGDKPRSSTEEKRFMERFTSMLANFAHSITPSGRKRIRETKIIGPLVVYMDMDHVVDRFSRWMFPVMFILFNIVFFLFHHIHEDTVT